MTTPSVAGINLTKTELINLADRMRAKAQAEHDDALSWRNRALAAEQRLALYDQREKGNQ